MTGPRRAPWVACEVLGGRAVLFDEQSLAVHLLNETATAVWGALDGTRTVDAIVGSLAARGRAVPTVGDVEALLADLTRLGLIENPCNGRCR